MRTILVIFGLLCLAGCQGTINPRGYSYGLPGGLPVLGEPLPTPVSDNAVVDYGDGHRFKWDPAGKVWLAVDEQNHPVERTEK